MGIFANAKDRLVEMAALSYLNEKFLAPYGRATSLRLNSTEKTIHLEVELKGETQPVQIEVTDYEIIQDGERYFASVKNIRTSREWLTTLARNQLRNERFELPAQAGRMLLRAL